MEVKIPVFSRTQKTTDGRKYTRYTTKYLFKNEDGTRTSRYVDIQFCGEDAFKGSPVAKNDIKRGYLIVDGAKVNMPDKYDVTTDENGKKVYPKCKIFGGIKSYQEVLKEHTFHFDSDLESEDSAEDEELSDLPAEEQ